MPGLKSKSECYYLPTSRSLRKGAVSNSASSIFPSPENETKRNEEKKEKHSREERETFERRKRNI